MVEDQILAEGPNSLCPPCNGDVVDPPSSETEILSEFRICSIFKIRITINCHEDIFKSKVGRFWKMISIQILVNISPASGEKCKFE